MKRRAWNSTLPAPTKPLRSKGGSRFPKVRDPDFCRWVCSHSCLVGSRECWGPVQPAHVGRTRAVGTPDRGEVVPLCAEHHTQQEGKTAEFERKQGLEPGTLQRTALRLAEIYEQRKGDGWD